jgi:DNA-binding MarR family transcriptional regulator
LRTEPHRVTEADQKNLPQRLAVDRHARGGRQRLAEDHIKAGGEQDEVAGGGGTGGGAIQLVEVRGQTPALGTDTAGMTRLLDRLEDKNLVRRVRESSDRRSVRVELTDAGAALAPRLAPAFGMVTSRLFAGFSSDDLQTLTLMLGRMLDNLAAQP